MRALSGLPRLGRTPCQIYIITVETFSMFKKLVPVLSMILLAGPVFAADTTPPAQDTSASAPAKSAKKHHKKHHKAAASGDQAASQPK